MKIGLLWARFGPYHVARLAGASQAAREDGGDVLGIQVAGRDDIYEWDPVETDGMESVTLFPDTNYESIPGREIRRRLSQVLDDAGCQVVTVNGWGTPEGRAGIAWRREQSNRRAVLMSETAQGNRRRWLWKEWVKRRLVARCDAALVGGRAQVAYLKELGFPEERIFTGYDAVDNAYFESASDSARDNATVLRQRLDLPENYFLACTRFLERKNVDGLLRAYDRYRSTSRDPWALVILGSGREEPRLRELQRALKLEGVIWPGFVQYQLLPAYYGLASAFIHPAKTEAWGLVVNEAAASGLPLLLSRTVGAAHELVDEGANGSLFDPDDIDGMAEVMVAMTATRDETRCWMGTESRRIANKWCPRHFGRQLMTAVNLATSLPDR